jgi:hypothetical protein
MVERTATPAVVPVLNAMFCTATATPESSSWTSWREATEPATSAHPIPRPNATMPMSNTGSGVRSDVASANSPQVTAGTATPTLATIDVPTRVTARWASAAAPVENQRTRALVRPWCDFSLSPYRATSSLTYEQALDCYERKPGRERGSRSTSPCPPDDATQGWPWTRGRYFEAALVADAG